jgi:hypothetical protein
LGCCGYWQQQCQQGKGYQVFHDKGFWAGGVSPAVFA